MPKTAKNFDELMNLYKNILTESIFHKLIYKKDCKFARMEDGFDGLFANTRNSLPNLEKIETELHTSKFQKSEFPKYYKSIPQHTERIGKLRLERRFTENNENKNDPFRFAVFNTQKSNNSCKMFVNTPKIIKNKKPGSALGTILKELIFKGKRVTKVNLKL